LTNDSINLVDAAWLPDGTKVLFNGAEPGHAQRTYIQDLNGGAPRPVTPEGTVSSRPSRNGKQILGRDAQGKTWLYALDGRRLQRVPALDGPIQVVQWTEDSNAVYVVSGEGLLNHVYRLDVATGRKQLVREIHAADPAGVVSAVQLVMTPDARAYAYGFGVVLSRLNIVDGVRGR
jgi:Tol biopolymer transport system component